MANLILQETGSSILQEDSFALLLNEDDVPSITLTSVARNTSQYFSRAQRSISAEVMATNRYTTLVKT